MSTRSTLDFYAKEPTKDIAPVARLYHHSDGYPSWRMKDIKAAYDLTIKHYDGGGFSYRVKQLGDYISDLAAFYVLANKDGAGDLEIDNRPLHMDIEYHYELWAEDGVLLVKINDIYDHTSEQGTLAELHAKHAE